MEIRPIRATDLDALSEIDGTVHSTRYLHIDSTGKGMNRTWRLEERELRTKIIEPNRLSEESAFLAKQISLGVEEGIALVAEHDGLVAGSLLAQKRQARGVLKVIDLRVDFEQRRQGLATVMMYQLFQAARDQSQRAVMVETVANNFPAAEFLAKLGFEIAGLDVQRQSNHDLVKEAVALFWYQALD